jgi:hypothetical protein
VRRDLSALVAPVVPGTASAPPEPEAPSAGAAQVRAPEIAELAPQIARAKAIAVTKTAPSRRLQPGDLICGTGNPSTRRFCSRCGSSLIEAVSVREPWWRRWLRKLMPRRGPKVVALGTGTDGRTEGAPAAHLAKPGVDVKHTFRRFLRTARVVLAVVLLVGGLLYGVYPPLRNSVNHWVGRVKANITNDIGSNLAPIHPVSVTANITGPGSSALNASDENLNTSWLAPWSSTAEPTLTLNFAHRVTLKQLILHSGAGTAFVQHGRPSSLILKFSNGESVTLSPQDTAQSQTISFGHADLISSVQIQVAGIYPGTSGSDVAITEIELFGLSL